MQCGTLDWIWSVWTGAHGGVGLSRGYHPAHSCQDTQHQCGGGAKSQVPPGGGHHGPVQTPQRGQTVRSGHCGGTSEWGINALIFDWEYNLFRR